MIGDIGGRLRAAMEARGHGDSIDALLAALSHDVNGDGAGSSSPPSFTPAPHNQHSFDNKISYNLPAPSSTGNGNANSGANPFAFPTFGGPGVGGVTAAQRAALQTPPETALGGSFDYGRGNARPDAGNTPMWHGQASSDLPGGTQVSAATMGRLLGLFTPVPGQAGTAGFNWWDRGHDSSPTNAADFNPAGAGDAWMNNWQRDRAGYWDAVHPGQGLAGNNVDYGGNSVHGGSAGRDPYYGGTSPWDWGANYY